MIASIRRGRFCTAARITWLLMILKQLKEKVAWTSSRTWPRVIASSTSWRKRLCYLSWILQPAHGEFLWPSACRAGTFVITSSSPWKRLFCCRLWALVNSSTSPWRRCLWPSACRTWAWVIAPPVLGEDDFAAEFDLGWMSHADLWQHYVIKRYVAGCLRKNIFRIKIHKKKQLWIRTSEVFGHLYKKFYKCRIRKWT